MSRKHSHRWKPIYKFSLREKPVVSKGPGRGVVTESLCWQREVRGCSPQTHNPDFSSVSHRMSRAVSLPRSLKFWLLSLCFSTYFSLIVNITLGSGPALPCSHTHTKISEGQSSQDPSCMSVHCLKALLYRNTYPFHHITRWELCFSI